MIKTTCTSYFSLLLLLLIGCRSGYHPTGQTYSRLPIDSTITIDSSLVQLLQPYRQNIDRTINEVLTRSTAEILKQKPEGPLNDLLADALLQQATQRFGKPIDCAQLNYTGIRNDLPRGNITIGTIFEVMPFDNQLVVIALKGDGLLRLFNHFAQHDETLVVAGVRVVMKGQQVQSIQFNNGQPFHPEQTYTVAMSDYVANGGSGAHFLSTTMVRRNNLNYLLRDAFVDYFRQQGKSGQPLTPTTDGRIATQ